MRRRVFQLACGYADQNDADQLLTAVLRPGNVHASHDVVPGLTRVARLLRARWPDVQVELRPDSGLAIPARSAFCETETIGYTLGLVRNPRLQTEAAPRVAHAQPR